MTDAAEPAVQWIGESVNDIAVRLRRRDAEYVFSAVDDIAPRCPRPRQSGRNKPRATCEPRPTLRRNLAARTARRAVPTRQGARSALDKATVIDRRYRLKRALKRTAKNR